MSPVTKAVGGVRALPARLTARFYDLRLAWKLMLPYALLLLVLGSVGSFIVGRTASDQAQRNLDHELARLSVSAEAHLRDEALFLSESAQVGANLEGIPEAVAAGDAEAARTVIASLVGGRRALDFVVVTDASGTGLVEISRRGENLDVGGGGSWSGRAFVAEVLQGLGGGDGSRRIGFLRVGQATMLASAAPVDAEGLVGVVVAGIDTRRLVEALGERAGAGAALYGADGALVAAEGSAAPRPPDDIASPVRRIEERDGPDAAVLYAPFEALGNPLGTFAVGLPSDEFLGSVGATALRVSLLLLAGMVAVVAIGTLLSRAIVRQVRVILDTKRALGHGDLSARAQVFGSDELGELAMGLNAMAEQLQASRDDLERTVVERTEELERLYGELVELTEGRSEAFAGVVHDLRGHLFVIGGYASLMRDSRHAPRARRWRQQYGQAIAAETEALLEQVNRILEVSRAEAGRIPLQLDDVVVADVVGGLRRTMEGLAMAAEVDLAVDVPDDLPPVRADAPRLAQVLMNLVSNAVKYTPPGGTVQVSAARQPGHVEISVSDTGVGISDEAGERIFEPFYQVPGSRAHKDQASSGLGLALVKRLVEAHGGTVVFRSRPGAGTTFAFTVPAVEPVAEADRAVVEANR